MRTQATWSLARKRPRTRSLSSGTMAVSPDAADASAPSSPEKEYHLPSAIHYSYHDMKGRWSFLADNEFITRGYRASLSWKECALSLFRMHNETMNVWSHFLGAVLFVVLILHIAMVHLPTHYASHECDNFVMDGGLHTARAFDVAIFPRSGAWTGKCIPTCDPVPTLVWMQERSHEGKEYIIELERHLVHMVKEVKRHNVTDNAARTLHAVQDSLSERLAHAREAMANPDSPLGAALERATQAMAQLKRAAKDAADFIDRERYHVPLPRWPIVVFLASAVLCLAFSAAFHLFYVVDPATYKVMSKLDYTGISILIAGSCIPTMYYSFCNPFLRWSYIALTCTICGICVVVGFIDKFARPQFRGMRIILYISAGLSGIFPVMHLIFRLGVDSDTVQVMLWNLLLMGALYIVGALLYAMRIPERFFPGKFDYMLSSHQIFHVMVLSAAVVHYFGVMGQFQYRQAERCFIHHH